MNQKGSPREAGVIHLAIPLILLLVAGAAVYLLIYFGVIKNPLPTSLRKLATQQPIVAVRTDYKNPFDKKSQYVNPFDQYKSPFLNLKKEAEK